MSFLRTTWIVFTRQLQLSVSNPVWVIIGLVQPLLYLALFGSLVAFTAYAWLLQNAPISQVVTHQYVNPLVAIVLGAVVLGETFDATTILGGLVVIGAVFATIRSETRSAAPVPAAINEQPRSAPPVRAK